MEFKNIYIHIPFCEQKCDYCSFYSVPNPTPLLIDAFLDKVDTELNSMELLQPVDSLYLGGGTPTILGEHRLNRLIEIIRQRIPLHPDAEITIECNPESFDQARMKVLDGFANRFSIGIQTFNDQLRQMLGRKAARKHIDRALQLVHGRNVNIDLIYGIPGQTLKHWQEELKITVEVDISHLSCYALTLEEGTALARKLNGAIPSVDDETTAAMWEETGSHLEDHGFSRYEVSNYCKKGTECRHNLNVWYGKPYLGIGPAAASFDGRMRWQQSESLSKWLKNHPPEKDIIAPEYRMVEIFIIGLRTARGWTRERWEEIPLQDTLPVKWETMLRRAFKVKNRYPELLAADPVSIRLTSRGLLFWNTIAEAWLE